MIKITPFGSSHSLYIGANAEGLPKNQYINVDAIRTELRKRRSGMGRSARQSLEEDIPEILSGLDDKGYTDGTPFVVRVKNKDDKLKEKPPITALRPNHADFSGCVKLGITDARQVAEYVGGRSTLPYTAIGNVCKQILNAKGIDVFGYTKNIGGVAINDETPDIHSLKEKIEKSDLRCFDSAAETKMKELIIAAKQKGDTLGGIVQVRVVNMPVGVGDFYKYEDKLDANIASCLMGIPSVKGVQFGLGADFASQTGRSCADKLGVVDGNIKYLTNNCGGITGGMSNGADILVDLFIKPVPSTENPVDSIDIITKKPVPAHFERSDVCVAPNIAVIAENMICTVLLSAILQDKRISERLGLC